MNPDQYIPKLAHISILKTSSIILCTLLVMLYTLATSASYFHGSLFLFLYKNMLIMIISLLATLPILLALISIHELLPIVAPDLVDHL